MTDVTVLRLKSGETLIAGVRLADDNNYWLDDPIAVIAVQVNHDGVNGETFLLKPWIGISPDKSFLLSAKEILTSCSLKENLLQQYLSYTGNYPEPYPEPVEDIEDFDEMEMLQARILRSKGLLN
jgi:hypothetical protein